MSGQPEGWNVVAIISGLKWVAAEPQNVSMSFDTRGRRNCGVVPCKKRERLRDMKREERRNRNGR